MTRHVEILETTLRDGSYANNFSFTANDTAIICGLLESVGFRHIEIGHGVGLNASSARYGIAVQSDEEYMDAASEGLSTAQWGMFCIPGIARLRDVDLAAEHGMGFIRIGTNVTEAAEAEPFIDRAKSHGMLVCANFMKSYAMEPREFAQTVMLSEGYGADIVYIVDSAGGMFPQTLRRYYEAIRDVSQIPIGFHGHDNLRLAVSNSLEAADMGCAFIDSSLQGLGRSSGNAATEILVAALMKLGYDTGIDFDRVLEIGQDYIQELVPVKGVAPLDVVAGYAEFHSSYMPLIMEYAAKYRVSPTELIIELCKVDRVNVDSALVERVAAELDKKPDLYLGRYGFNRYVGGEQDEHGS